MQPICNSIECSSMSSLFVYCPLIAEKYGKIWLTNTRQNWSKPWQILTYIYRWEMTITFDLKWNLNIKQKINQWHKVQFLVRVAYNNSIHLFIYRNDRNIDIKIISALIVFFFVPLAIYLSPPASAQDFLLYMHYLLGKVDQVEWT